MQQHITITKELLFDYFKGNATVIQKHELESWLKIAENQETYFEFLEEFEQNSMQWYPNSEIAFEELMVKVEEEEVLVEPMVAQISAPKRKLWFFSLSAAAILVLMFLFSDVVFWKSIETGYGETSSLVLPDGSKVTLNANSVLQIPRFEISSGTREVRLDGEAYFTVTHTKDDRKFVVRTSEDFQVEVLGTEFSVKKRAKGVQVLLDKGKVKVHYAKMANAITMKPGDLVTLDKEGKISKLEDKEIREFTAWRSQKFVFNKTSLGELGQLIKDNYNVEVVIKAKELSDRTISGEIDAKNLDELLSAISTVFNLKITQNEKTIEITSK